MMRAIGEYLIVQDAKQEVRKTHGGLELTDKHEKIRYITADVVSFGDSVVGIKNGNTILYDRVGGHDVIIDGELLKVIRFRDIVLVHDTKDI